MTSKKRKRQPTTSQDAPPSVVPHPLQLLDLPLEIRQKIYDTFFKTPTRCSECNWYCYSMHRHEKSASSAILHLSRQIHAEAWPYYTKHCCFNFNLPFQLANEFLSFLPKQRLACVKHLTLDTSNWQQPSHLEEFELTWWYYLDVFTRLDTLAFECDHYRKEFFTIIMLLIGLLEQGATTRPKWVMRKKGRAIRRPPIDLPFSHPWVLQCVAGVISGPDQHGQTRFSNNASRIILRKTAHSHPHDELFGSWRPLIGSGAQWQVYHWKFLLSEKSIDQGQTAVHFSDVDSYFRTRFVLGRYTRLLNKLQPELYAGGGKYEVESLIISGSWINRTTQ